MSSQFYNFCFFFLLPFYQGLSFFQVLCTFSIQKCLYYSSFSLLSYKFLQIHIYFFFVFKILFKFLQKIKSLKNSHFSKGKETAANECNYRNRVYMDYIWKASRIIHKVITVSIWWNLYKKLLASNWNYRHYFLPSIQPPPKIFFFIHCIFLPLLRFNRKESRLLLTGLL